MTARLFTASERGLATLRIKAFRHVHDLPLLTQNTERRGALVSRVTSDVDQVSQFLVFGGVFGIVSVGQVLLATVVMLVLLAGSSRSWSGSASCRCSSRCATSSGGSRRPTAWSGAGRRDARPRSPSPSSARRPCAPTRSRTAPRTASTRRSTVNQAAATRAQGLTAFSFSPRRRLGRAGQRRRARSSASGSGFAGEITSGEVLAFAFLVTLFVGPVQMGTQMLTDAQNAIAGWRRVIGILETPADLVDPGADGQVAAARADRRRASRTSSFAYPGGPLVLRDVDLAHRVRHAGSRSSARPARARRRSPSCSPG